MNDPKEFDPIAASLQRQFSPPPMDALAARIAKAAAEVDAAVDDRLVAPAARPKNARRWVFGAAVGLAAAAAVLLTRSDGDSSPVQTPPSTRAPAVIAQASPPPQRAGEQLDTFLRLGAQLPGEDGSCAAAPPPSCDFESAPHLLQDASVVQVGECGGTSNVACRDFDLPADRALLVQLMPSGQHAVVCIEHPWTDPHPELPAHSEHNIFRRELGNYVIYEITPLDHPVASDRLRL